MPFVRVGCYAAAAAANGSHEGATPSSYATAPPATTTHALPLLLSPPGGGRMSPTRCARLAVEAAVPLFALQDGQHCWGGYSLQRAVALGGSYGCLTPCTGIPTKMCGGADANEVYAFDFCGGGYLGCFGEAPTFQQGYAMPYELQLPNGTAVGDNGMTSALCRAAARRLRFPFYGLAMGKRCWLGVSLPVAMRWGVRSSCSQPCSGDPQRVCGGAAPTEFSLYRTDTCPEGKSTCLSDPCGGGSGGGDGSGGGGSDGGGGGGTSTSGLDECVSVPRLSASGDVWLGMCIARSGGIGAPGLEEKRQEEDGIGLAGSVVVEGGRTESGAGAGPGAEPSGSNGWVAAWRTGGAA